MPAKHVIDIKSKLLVSTWEGDVTANFFIDALKKYQKNILNKSEHYGFNEIFDLRDVENIELTAGELKKIGAIASKTDNQNIHTKIAFIVSSNLAFGLAIIYVAYRSFSKNSNKTMRVFKKESDAYKWAQE